VPARKESEAAPFELAPERLQVDPLSATPPSLTRTGRWHHRQTNEAAYGRPPLLFRWVDSEALQELALQFQAQVTGRQAIHFQGQLAPPLFSAL
jgi:hypothetical protein